MSWPITNGSANVLRQSYVSGFLDVSGTSIFRNDLSLNTRLFVGGYVGIGTTTPNSPLNVYSSSTVQFGIDGPTTQSNGLTINSGGTQKCAIIAVPSAGGWSGDSSVGDLVIRSGTSNRMFLNVSAGGSSSMGLGPYITLGYSSGTYVTNGCNANSNSHVIFTGSSIRTDGPLILPYSDGNNLMNFSNASGTSMKGYIASSNSTSIAYNSSSDRRLKTNIKPMSSMINKIKQLNPAHFTWITDGIKDDGFIAQEVHKIFPNFIGTVNAYCDTCNCCRNDIYDGKLCECCDWENPVNKDNGNMYIHSLDYGKFTPYLTKGLQEVIEITENQQTTIETQKQEIIDLQATIQSQQTTIDAILQRLSSAGIS
jgi:hypothetical protein